MDKTSIKKLIEDALEAAISKLPDKNFMDNLVSNLEAKLQANLVQRIDLLAILQKSLDRAIFLYNFIRKVRLSGVRASIAIVHIRKFYKI